MCCIQEAFIAKGIVPLEPGWKRAYKKLDAQKTNSEQKSTEAPTMIVPDVKKDDQALNTEAQVKSKKTTPPKRYTEGTLLGAMENIAREIEDPRLQTVMKNKEKAGIGTDATRAEVIETLLRRHYIALEKKELKPTAKGTELITLVEKIDPMIADPVLTAMWEDQLSAIEQGGLSLGDFEAAIGQWLTLRIQTIKDKAPARTANPARLQQSNYACPQCAAQKQTSTLSLFSKGLKCTKCNFILWTEVSGYTLQDSEITILLQGKTTPPLSLTSRQGKPYQASLRIGSKWKVEQLFQNASK